MTETEKNDLLADLPKKRITPILCLTDQDLFDAGIDPASLTDKQFLEIAEGLKYRYEEEMPREEPVDFFQNNVRSVINNNYGRVYPYCPSGDYRYLETGDMPYFSDQEEVWLGMPFMFSIPTKEETEDGITTESGFLTVSRTNGAWVWHSDIIHYPKFDTWQGERVLKIFVEDSDVLETYT